MHKIERSDSKNRKILVCPIKLVELSRIAFTFLVDFSVALFCTLS